MLNAEQIEALRQVLMQDRERLLRRAQDGLEFSMNREQRSVGRDSIDESMEEEIFSTELRLRDREKFLLGKIDEALVRLKAGSISECEDCGEQISYRRLMARPVTTLCIDCKQDRESAEEQSAMAAAPEEGGMGLGRAEPGALEE